MHTLVVSQAPLSSLPSASMRSLALRRSPIDVVLIIDDDPSFGELMCLLLQRQGYEVEHVVEIPKALKKDRYSAILLDRNLGDADGIDKIGWIRAAAPAVPVILVTVEQSIEIVVRAIKAGAFDYLTKPTSEERLLTMLHRACEHYRAAVALFGGGQSETGYHKIIGASHAMRAAYRVIANVAPTDVSVMICGETGTGKELFAHTLHECSSRAAKPFVALNMAGIPKDLVESTLFGSEKGAFSGADRRRIGVCEEAEGGTLFLDEITEMPLELQAKLLRFLQERTIRRVGGTGDIKVNVRVLSATNHDPAESVSSGKLRSDLFYRLNVVPLALPALRDRSGDVELLARKFLCALNSRHGREFTVIDDDALDALAAHHWPGNVRELQHAIERLVVMNSGTNITLEMIPMEIRHSADSRPTRASAPRIEVSATIEHQAVVGALAFSPPASGSARTLESMEADAIRAALKGHGDSPAAAAKSLGISTATIYRKIKQFAIE